MKTSALKRRPSTVDHVLLLVDVDILTFLLVDVDHPDVFVLVDVDVLTFSTGRRRRPDVFYWSTSTTELFWSTLDVDRRRCRRCRRPFLLTFSSRPKSLGNTTLWHEHLHIVVVFSISLSSCHIKSVQIFVNISQPGICLSEVFEEHWVARIAGILSLCFKWTISRPLWRDTNVTNGIIL